MEELGRLRVVRCGTPGPAWNMAVDEALLRHGGPATLRLYGWRPDALSLGRFQREEEFLALDPAPGGIVRRCTGGGAIHHQEEVTFALALPAGLLPGGLEASYRLVHGAVARALARLGVRAAHPGNPSPRRASGRGAALCFAAATALDLVLPDGRKVVGSAQRRAGGRVLHHGSIPLAPPALTPWAGFAPVPRAALEDLLALEISSALRLERWDGTLGEGETLLAARIASGARSPRGPAAQGPRASCR